MLRKDGEASGNDRSEDAQPHQHLLPPPLTERIIALWFHTESSNDQRKNGFQATI
jgi:hypothetical protein